jgi:hypothetical protein
MTPDLTSMKLKPDKALPVDAKFGAGEGIPTNNYNKTIFFAIITHTEPAQARQNNYLGRQSAQFLHRR